MCKIANVPIMPPVIYAWVKEPSQLNSLFLSIQHVKTTVVYLIMYLNHGIVDLLMSPEKQDQMNISDFIDAVWCGGPRGSTSQMVNVLSYGHDLVYY